MSNSQFIFVRHGQSQGNATGIIADPRHPLTEQGIGQARKTGNELKGKGVTLIVCSPFLRAQQTAETIAGELGIDITHIQIIDELRERNQGTLENHPKEHDTPWYYLDHDEIAGQETRQALYDRMKVALEKIKELGAQEKVLAIGHGISGYFLLRIAANDGSLDDFDGLGEMSNADFIEVEIKN
jgi:broad specificity phosphatase PhoE